MKVILQKDIPNLGDAGDIREVADGYARNFLLPRNMVVPATAASKKAKEHQERMIRIKKDKRRKESEKVLDSINGKELTFTVQVGEEGKLFGSVTSMDMAKSLKEEGFAIDKRKIALDTPIKQTGEYEIPIKLDDGLTAHIKVIVRGEESQGEEKGEE